MPTRLVKPGDVIYVHLTDQMEGTAHRATLEQDSGAQGALMAIDNTTGDVLAMVGGRDYALSAVQPGDPGGTADRLQLQALCLHHGGRRRRQARRHHRGCAGELRRLTRRTITRTTTRAR